VNRADLQEALRARVRAAADRFFTMTAVLPGLRGRRGSASLDEVPPHAEPTLQAPEPPELHDQTHPAPPRLERGHPKR